MSNPTIVRRAVAVLALPRNVPTAITYTAAILQAVTGNPHFPNPSPPVATLQNALDELQAAEAVATTRARGTAALRNQKRAALVSLLETLRAYVQAAADAQPEDAPGIIQSAGLALRKPRAPTSLGFHAKRGHASGTLKLFAPAAARRATYFWEYSADGGATWVQLPPTLQSRTTVSGLEPLTEVRFRYQALTRSGAGDWSNAITVAVV